MGNIDKKLLWLNHKAIENVLLNRPRPLHQLQYSNSPAMVVGLSSLPIYKARGTVLLTFIQALSQDFIFVSFWVPIIIRERRPDRASGAHDK